MTTVNESLQLPGGAAAEGALVSVFLAGANGDPIGEAYIPGETLVSRLQIRTGANGDWSADLAANADITPSGTVWARTVETGRNSRTTEYATVPGAGPVDWQDILTDPPGALTPSALAAHIADRGTGSHLPDGPTSDGDVPTAQADGSVAWEALGASQHPDLAAHDTLGLATQAELDAHLNDATDAHDASAVSVADAAGDFTATTVEGVLAELQSDAEADAANLTTHSSDTTAVHGIADTSVLETTSGAQAKADAAQAFAIQRANHTGTQLASTISDLSEAVQDIAGAQITAGEDISVTYDDVAGTVTVAVAGLDSSDISDFAEAVRDRIGGTLVAGTGIDVTVSDVGDTVTIALDAAAVTQAELDAHAADTSTHGVSDMTALLDGTTHDARDHSTALGTAAVGDLADVASTAPSDADGLVWESTASEWQPSAVTQPGDDAATLGSGAATNGQTLTADGVGGAAWQTPAGGGGGATIPLAPVPNDGVNLGWRYGLSPWTQQTARDSHAFTANTLYYFGVWCPTPLRITDLIVEVMTADVGSTVRLGIVALGFDAQPSSLVADAGAISSGTTGEKTLSALTADLAAGPHALAAISDGTPTLRRLIVTESVFGSDGSAVSNRNITHTFIANQAAQHAGFSAPPPDWDTLSSSSALSDQIVKFRFTAQP